MKYIPPPLMYYIGCKSKEGRKTSVNSAHRVPIVHLNNFSLRTGCKSELYTRPLNPTLPPGVKKLP